ncbi:L30e-like protein [Daldinia decipiens]|uniref:L30e-like protein n=1 Tax=Daldinia decipiens TaxID=326647 RepID=UPI0020C53831|nr:L30e-like protein [Daldinia decipiens]KAI1662574.1 L30e-like protein [Daldinia decipiens]
MGSTKPEKEKKEKKDKKRSEADGVTKSKKDKKDKKDKKEKLKTVVTATLDDQLEVDTSASVTVVKDGEEKVAKVLVPVVGALVPFAKPLADEKGTKKIMKTVRKAAKHKTLKRGVKEVVKSLRKSPASGPGNTSFPGVVILAGDISPMDVISHIPVLCEDVNVPYIFVTSRAELGAAGSTKRPTSVVMVTEKRTGSKKDKADEKIAEEDAEDFADAYKDLVKLVEKESKQLKFT